MAIANEAARMVQEKRWLAAGALLSESRQYPSLFETRLAALGARPSWLAPRDEIDIGPLDADWVATSATGGLIAIGARDGTMAFVFPDGQLTWPNRSSAREGQVAFAENGESLWFAAEDEGLFSLQSAQAAPQRLGSPAERPNRVARDRLSSALLVGSAGVGLWQMPSTGATPAAPLAAIMFNEVASSRDGEVLAATDFALNLHLWRGRRRELLRTMALSPLLDAAEIADGQVGLPHPPVALSAAGDRVATILDLGGRAVLLLIEPDTGRLVRKQLLSAVDVVGERPLGFTADGTLLVVRHRLGLVAFSSASGELAWRGPERARPPSSIAVDPLGRFVAAAFGAERIELLSLLDGSLLESVDGHAGVVGAVAFSGDGSTLISASNDGKLRRWTVAQPRAPEYILGGRGYLSQAAFGAHGRLAAAFLYRGAHLVATFDHANRAHPAILSSTPIAHLAWSEDGRALAAVTGEGRVLVWNEGDEEIATTPAATAGGEIHTLAARPQRGGFFALRDERLDLLDERGRVQQSIAFPEPWPVRRGPYPLAAEADRFSFLTIADAGTQLVEWSRASGWRKGPVLEEEPLFLLQRGGATILVGKRTIQAWQPLGPGLERLAFLTNGIPHGGPAALLDSGFILARPAGDSSSQRLQLELELIDLATGKQQVLADPWTRELVADSENFIAYLGAGRKPGTLLSLCRSSLVLEWGISVDPESGTPAAITGLDVEGTSVRPSVALSRTADATGPPSR